MTFNITRMSVYALIGSLEEDLRSLIKQHMGHVEPDDPCLDQKLIERSRDRIRKDIGDYGDLSLKDIVDYFDFGDAYQTVNACASFFPAHISRHIKDSTKTFQSIVPIRNRVMHIRPLNFDDHPNVLAFCGKLVDQMPSLWSGVGETLRRLESDPSFLHSIEIKNVDDDNSIRHNLPLPDFDETGLIGRDDDVKKLVSLCNGGFPVISILGEGVLVRLLLH